MSTIGYAIFKKTKDISLDVNGLFTELKLPNSVFIDNSVKLKAGEKRISIQRIATNKIKSSVKDAVLITSTVQVQKDTTLGSAIIFKGFQVNENKIIDGVQYLLSQLIRSFNDESNPEGDNLGVILPSVNGNFNLFKESPLDKIILKQNVKYVDFIPLEKEDIAKTLHHFTAQGTFKNITNLLLVSNQNTITEFMDNGFEKVNTAKLIIPPKIKQPVTSLSQQRDKEKKELEAKLITAETERENAVNTKKQYGLFAILSFIGLLIFSVLYFTKKTENEVANIASDKSTLYEMNEKMYISFHKYNVNIRSTPIYYKDNRNVKATLSDGDEIKVLGFDKQTMWAKISYNEDREVGFVSNKLISKKIDRDRVRKIKRNARIKDSYYNVPIYTAPEEIGEYEKYKDKIKFLNANDKIYVKSEDLRLNSFSIMYKKNGKTLHGYIQSQYFKYQ